MASMLRRSVAALPLLLALAPGVWAGQRVVILTLSDSIQPASLRYLERGLEVADSSGAAVTIIELNTPGGLLTSLRQMTTAITGCPPAGGCLRHPGGRRRRRRPASSC